MIYKLIYALSVLGIILNASPASADQRGEDQKVESLRTSMRQLLLVQDDSGDEDSEENWHEYEHVEGLTIVVGSMVLGPEETEVYDVSSEAPSEGSEDVEEEEPDESAPTHQPQSPLQTSLPQPDFSAEGGTQGLAHF